jgi:hypothetical protein
MAQRIGKMVGRAKPGDEKLHDLLAVRRIKARDLAELDVFDPDPRHVAIPARAQMFQLIDLFLEFAISLPDTHLPAHQARMSHVQAFGNPSGAHRSAPPEESRKDRLALVPLSQLRQSPAGHARQVNGKFMERRTPLRRCPRKSQ